MNGLMLVRVSTLAARYQMIHGPVPVRGQEVGDHCYKAFFNAV